MTKAEGMDFDDTAEEADFRREARSWLEEHATRRQPDSTETHTFPEAGSADEAAHVAAARAWQRTLYDGGWAGLTWPATYGGRGLTANHQRIFNQELAVFDVPLGVFSQAIGMVGPTLIAHGSEDQKRRFLDPILRGEMVWCQLFSEPEAGSDLAGLRTRAVLDDDHYVVNGQKVWTSNGHYSDWGMLLARTDPGQARHNGITYFLVDMTSAGLDVRPLRQITGVAHFDEVFLTDVHVPVGNVVGAPGQGWTVARTTLTHERADIAGFGRDVMDELTGLARSAGRVTDPVTRQALAAIYTDLQVLKYNGFRVQTAMSKGAPVGPESSIGKLVMSRHLSRLADTAMTLGGPASMLADDNRTERWVMSFLNQWMSKIGGGTDQIQRNIVGERVLGLPREPNPTPR